MTELQTAVPADTTAVVAGGARHGRVRALLRNPSGVIGLALLAIPLILAVIDRLGVLPYTPTEQNAPDRLQGPSGDHLFGTDQFGRDLLARVAGGVANSLLVAFLAVAVAAVVGTLAGLVAGFYRGAADSVIGAVSNVIFAFPPLLLALCVASVVDRNRVTVALSIAIVYVPIFTRVVRGPVLSLREVEFVRAATATGQSRLSVMLRHVLPNVTPILVVQITLSLSWAVLTEAALSFLGLGIPLPSASLGSMIYEARTLMYRSPATMVFPGVVVVLIVVSLNLLGDGLRDTLDPRATTRNGTA